MQLNKRHLTTLATVALVVAMADLASKKLVVELAAAGVAPAALLGESVHLVLVHNDLGAFSMALGAYTWNINIGVTTAALVLAVALCPLLAGFGATAPLGLGLIAGAALGNLVSLLSSPAGVVDFMAVAHGDGRQLVFNLADVASYAGLLLCVRLAWSIVAAMRRAG